MRSHSRLVPPAASALLVIGCQSLPPAVTDGQIAETQAEDALAFPAERTATLWVLGLACPY